MGELSYCITDHAQLLIADPCNTQSIQPLIAADYASGSAHRAASPIRNVIRSDLKWMTCAIISHSVQVRSMIPSRLRTRTLHCIGASAESNLEDPSACMKDACCRRMHHGSANMQSASCTFQLARGVLSRHPADAYCNPQQFPARAARAASFSMVCLRLEWRAYSRSYAPGSFGTRKSSRDCRYVTDGVIILEHVVQRGYSA